MMSPEMGISGTWVNKRTGEKVQVSSSVIDGDNMVVMTNLGPINMDKFGETYIQVSDDLYDNNGNKIGRQDVVLDDFMVKDKKPIKSVPTPSFLDEFETIDEIKGKTQKSTPAVNPSSPQMSQQEELLHKLFDKIESKPVVKISVEWKDYPKDEIEMLKKFFDVTDDDVTEYFYDHYINSENAKLIIDNNLNT